MLIMQSVSSWVLAGSIAFASVLIGIVPACGVPFAAGSSRTQSTSRLSG